MKQSNPSTVTAVINMPHAICRQQRGHGIAILLMTLLMLSPSLLPANDNVVKRMAEAMLDMMDAMGFIDDHKPGAYLPMNPANLGVPNMPSGMGDFSIDAFGLNTLGQQPGSPMQTNPAQTLGVDQMPWSLQGIQQMPQIPGLPTGWRRTALEGIWEGREGGLLIVQAHRFRLYSPAGGYIEGLIQQRGDRVALYEPRQQLARPYEFAQHQGRLVLRDAEGQVYLYRRLWFEPDDTSGSPAQR